LGKYGERVMDYGSDLDLMLVFDAEGIAAEVRSHQPEAIRLGQRLISRLQNRTMGMRLYEVDMRLRPSGRQGLLVSPLGGFRRYHASDLPVWERLALLRLRPVGEITIDPTLVAPGPAARAEPLGAQVAAALPGPLCREVLAVVGRTLRSEATPLQADDVARAVRQLKARIEHEVARESRAAGPFNAKSGYGGLLELELLVGALVLLHAPQRAALWHASLPEAIHLLAQAQIFTEEESCALGAAHRFLRIFLNRLRMTHAGGIDDLDRFAQNSPRLMTLARRMGLPSRDSLLEQFHEARAVVRTAFDRHL
jgi:glutamate-ammonia-ligase adenylyltransferase